MLMLEEASREGDWEELFFNKAEADLGDVGKPPVLVPAPRLLAELK